MVILPRSGPENINLHVQDFDEVPLTTQYMTKHMFAEAGRKLNIHFDLSLLDRPSLSFLLIPFQPHVMMKCQRAPVTQMTGKLYSSFSIDIQTNK